MISAGAFGDRTQFFGAVREMITATFSMCVRPCIGPTNEASQFEIKKKQGDP